MKANFDLRNRAARNSVLWLFNSIVCLGYRTQKLLRGASYCCGAGHLVTFGDKFFHSSLKHPSFQKNFSLAFEVFALASGSESGYFVRLRRFKSSSFHLACFSIMLFKVLRVKVSPGWWKEIVTRLLSGWRYCWWLPDCRSREKPSLIKAPINSLAVKDLSFE